MHPFYGPQGRRAIAPEIHALIVRRTASLPVCGFAEIVDRGGARCGSDRMAGFMEMADHREWLLPIDAHEGLTWRTECVPETTLGKIALVLSIGFGNGSPLPQPTGCWDLFVNDRFALSVRTVNHDQLWLEGSCALAFSANRIECATPYQSMTLSSLIDQESMAAFGPACLTVPTCWLQMGQPAVIRVEPRSDVPSSRWIQLAPPGALLRTADIYRIVDMLSGEARPRAGAYQIYFGDIHTHSGQVLEACMNKGCGRGTRAENYAYARGAGGLDFYALTDHEWQVDPDKIDAYLSLADHYEQEGRFICLPGFEHTDLLHGHRNVYFRDSGGTVFNTHREWGRPTLEPAMCHTPRDLWTAMERTGVPFLTVPHHPSAASHPLNLDFHDPRYDRLYEVYSCWGSSAYYGDCPRGVSDRLRTGDLHDALRRGQRYGITASSDGHDGHPGNAQSPLVKHHHLFHFCGSGRAAVLTHGLTRDEVFDALYARRCYATTGPPIVLHVTLNGAPMGSELAPLEDGAKPRLEITCRGTNGLAEIRILKNALVVQTTLCHGRFEAEIEWEDPDYRPGSSASYYVRMVQKDRESAWSSPNWVG